MFIKKQKLALKRNQAIKATKLIDITQKIDLMQKCKKHVKKSQQYSNLVVGEGNTIYFFWLY